MILVFLGISIAAVVIGVILCDKLDWKKEWMGILLTVVGGVTLVISLITTIGLIGSVVKLSVIDQKIEMYLTENANIEKQVAVAIEEYQQYEQNIIAEVSPDSSMTLVTIYPELKTDALIQRQIEIYIENTTKIKELKEAQIDGASDRWWLYFGG